MPAGTSVDTPGGGPEFPIIPGGRNPAGAPGIPGTVCTLPGAPGGPEESWTGGGMPGGVPPTAGGGAPGAAGGGEKPGVVGKAPVVGGIALAMAPLGTVELLGVMTLGDAVEMVGVALGAGLFDPPEATL